MSDSDAASTYVFAPEDIVWHKTDLGPPVLAQRQPGRHRLHLGLHGPAHQFGPGGGSPPHTHTYNHAFYFLSGTCRVQIGEQTWRVQPGTFVKVPAHQEHSVTNTGTEDLIFLGRSTTRRPATSPFRRLGPRPAPPTDSSSRQVSRLPQRRKPRCREAFGSTPRGIEAGNQPRHRAKSCAVAGFSCRCEPLSTAGRRAPVTDVYRWPNPDPAAT
jgi:mannose-6-phosphate isomerase-like protein (cupin superfamily)